MLPRYGATMPQLDVLIDILLVFYKAMKSSRRRWPVINEDVQERCLKRVVARVRFIEDLNSDLTAVAVKNALDDHPEKPMLAFVIGRMKQMLGIETETEKMMVLAALNLVECIGTAVVITGER